jgi:hypothetical protein
MKPYLFWIAVILAINPTLSLSSLAVGYESPIAACMLMITGLIIKSQQNPIDRRFWIRVAAVGGFFALAAFMQPRWLLTTLVVAIVWALAYKNRKQQALILIAVMAIMSIAPAALMARNIKAGNGAVISTNINAALAYGTGDQTSGGYQRTGEFIDCNGVPISEVTVGSDAILCTAKWYLSNPLLTLKLSWNKSIYFWSPWYGPLANGTMARNPWLKINPLQDIATQSAQGNNLVFGFTGKVISGVFIFLSIALLILGFLRMRKLGSVEKVLALILLISVSISWLVAIITLGDHRFRIPTMGLSLVLQVYGLLSLKDWKKVSK